MHKGIRSTWRCITDEMIKAVSHEKLNGWPLAVHTALSAPDHAENISSCAAGRYKEAVDD